MRLLNNHAGGGTACRNRIVVARDELCPPAKLIWPLSSRWRLATTCCVWTSRRYGEISSTLTKTASDAPVDK